MNMVFCRGCAKEIHTTAISCPQCGAQQGMTNSTMIAPSVPEEASGFGWYTLVLKKFAVFSGRARRKEYWMFMLFNVLIAIAIGAIEGAFRSKGMISNLYSLAMFVPGIAVGVRRLHDTNRSGWWLLLPIVNLVFLCLDSQREANRFGPSKKY